MNASFGNNKKWLLVIEGNTFFKWTNVVVGILFLLFAGMVYKFGSEFFWAGQYLLIAILFCAVPFLIGIGFILNAIISIFIKNQFMIAGDKDVLCLNVKGKLISVSHNDIISLRIVSDRKFYNPAASGFSNDYLRIKLNKNFSPLMFSDKVLSISPSEAYDKLKALFNYCSEGIVTKYQVEEVGLDWGYVSQTLIKNGWAELKKPTEIIVTASLEVNRGAIAQVFGDNYPKVLLIWKNIPDW